MLVWSEEYAIYEPSIDELHQELFLTVNKLTEAIEHEDNAFITDLFDTLEMYTLYHFSGEEAVMEKFNYPALDDHKNLHQELLEQLHSFKDKYFHKDITEFEEIKNFLEDWLKSHILIEDLKIRTFLEEKKQ